MIVHNDQGERLDVAVHEADGETTVVIGHGVTANKDRPFLVALAEGLAAAGIPAVRVSFSGNGESQGHFEVSTISKEVEDLGAVLDALDGPCVYVGHSMGAAVGVIRAASDERIRLLVSLAGMVDTADFYENKFGGQTPGESLMWDKPECPLSDAFRADMFDISSVARYAARIAIPWLLVHGNADTVVPFRDSKQVRSRASDLVEIEGADHLFTDHTSEMVAAVVPWLSARI